MTLVEVLTYLGRIVVRTLKNGKPIVPLSMGDPQTRAIVTHRNPLELTERSLTSELAISAVSTLVDIRPPASFQRFINHNLYRPTFPYKGLYKHLQ